MFVFLFGVVNLVAVINNISFRQEETPEDMQSRVNTTGRMLSWGLGAPAGALLGGVVVATRSGPRSGWPTGSVVVVVGVTLGWTSAPRPDPGAAGRPPSRSDGRRHRRAPANGCGRVPASRYPAGPPQPEEIPVLLRMSSLFLRTLREDPADAEVPSHRLLVRAGYVRRVAPGIFTWLPLG